MHSFEDIGSKDHFSAKKFFGVKNPPGQGSQKFFWVKRTSKMNSAPSNYSECKFSAKSDNFKKITIIGGDFLTFLGAKKPPQGGTRIF